MAASDEHLITARIASICRTCGLWSTDAEPTHVYQVKAFFCARCCIFCNQPLKEWAEAPTPVSGEQESMF